MRFGLIRSLAGQGIKNVGFMVRSDRILIVFLSASYQNPIRILSELYNYLGFDRILIGFLSASYQNPIRILSELHKYTGFDRIPIGF